MINVLVTGSNGQLGNEIRQQASCFPEFCFLFTDVQELDICNRDEVMRYVDDNKIDYILNCAAYTAVDKAEDEPALSYRVNCDAVENLALAAVAHQARVIHISTDYVYGGTSFRPYVEEDMTSPVSVYGQSKDAGEKLLMQTCPQSLVIRTSWLYSTYGNNFVKTMIRLGQERDELSVIFDQIGSPTYAGDLATAMLTIITQSENEGFRAGIYNFSNEGVCSWYDFTKAIHRLAGIRNCRVKAIETADYPSKATRPFYSVMNKKKIKRIFALDIPHWEESLTQCIAKLKEINSKHE